MMDATIFRTKEGNYDWRGHNQALPAGATVAGFITEKGEVLALGYSASLEGSEATKALAEARAYVSSDPGGGCETEARLFDATIEPIT